MARTYFKDFEREDGTEITVEYSITPYDPGVSSGPAESCYPPEGGEVEILKSFTEATEMLSSYAASMIEDIMKTTEKGCANTIEIRREQIKLEIGE